jgi:hypothetical protein
MVSAYAQSSFSPKIIVSTNVQSELFPVITKFVSEGNSSTDLPHTVIWEVKNNESDSIRITLTSEIPDWTPPTISTFFIGPNESKTINQTPFGIKFLSKHSTIPATIILRVKSDDKIIFEESKNINIRSADEMIWSLNSTFDTAPLIAAWVTPNNDAVEKILSNAKEKLSSRSLYGYQSSDVISQVKAIFNAVRNTKVSYINSTMSFGKVGFTQRVRLPQESILQKSANCIDGAVLFASLFENIGLEPLIILIPGHAFVAVRTSPGATGTIFIETTLIGRSTLQSVLTMESTFDAAVKQGAKNYEAAMKTNSKSVHVIDIKKTREIGIYPLW